MCLNPYRRVFVNGCTIKKYLRRLKYKRIPEHQDEMESKGSISILVILRILIEETATNKEKIAVPDMARRS